MLYNVHSKQIFMTDFTTDFFRTVVAALHFNENSERKYKTDLNNNLKYRIKMQKQSHKNFAVYKLKEEATYGR
jgi:hypothetical protein